jgi:hypothetical protein
MSDFPVWQRFHVGPDPSGATAYKFAPPLPNQYTFINRVNVNYQSPGTVGDFFALCASPVTSNQVLHVLDSHTEAFSIDGFASFEPFTPYMLKPNEQLTLNSFGFGSWLFEEMWVEFLQQVSGG